MSAKQHEEVLCKLCGQKLLLKNLKTHHVRTHDSSQSMGYTLAVSTKQKRLDFAPQSKKPKLDNKEQNNEELNQESEASGIIFDDLPEEEQSFQQTLILIIGAKSVEQLKFFTKKYFNFYDGQFTCIICGTIYKHDASGSVQWSNFKGYLKRHLISPMHAKNVEIVKNSEQKNREELAEAKNYAMSCAKTAYLCFKDNIPYDSYPYMLQLIHSSGGNVGHQQHSRTFAAKFLPIVSNIIRETKSDDVKKKLFEITADKITTHRRTRHIFGIRISQLNNITSEICAEDVYVSHSVVADVTSPGLAKHIIDCLEMFGINRVHTRENLIGMAFDGQYINMGVDKEICKQLNIEKTDTKHMGPYAFAGKDTR